MSDYLSLSLELNRIEQELKETREKLNGAIEVLDFYSAYKNYEAGGLIGPQETWIPAAISYDCGKRARQFLQTIREQNNV